MKKGKPASGNGLRREYDFSSMSGGIRGKHADRLREGSNMVLLDPDVAAAFPNGAAVNEALRAVLAATRVVRRERPRKRSSAGRR